MSLTKNIFLSAILFSLTLLSVASTHIDLGTGNFVLCLAIAFVQGALMLSLFMELKHSSRLLQGTFIMTIFIVLVLILLTYADVLFRTVIE